MLEGFYGRPYAWPERRALVECLAPAGYSFYLYAPKADDLLRRRWRDPFSEARCGELAEFATFCRGRGVRFGVGLSPFELYLGFDDAAKAALSGKLAELDALGIEDLGIFFDDMRGDVPSLAARQAEICHWIAARTAASRIMVCPTYYSDDPILDRVFGARPPAYLADLGRDLDPALALMWTGPEVCSREYSPGHLETVANALRRPPFLWDNYPVNDGPRMSRHLHLRAVTGRPAAIRTRLAGHAVNTASQVTLTSIPALTLTESYALGEAYDYGAAFRRAADAILGPELAAAVIRRAPLLEDVGLDGLDAERRARLAAEFAAFDHPAAREIVDWLGGVWAFEAEAAPT
jgi:hypothetical protein